MHKIEKIDIKDSQTYLNKWEVSNPIAIFQIVHGSKEHIGRYQSFIEFLNKNNIEVWAIDLRGHGKYAFENNKLGKMEGKNIKEDVLEDIEIVTKKIKSNNKFKDIPYIILGHSMGSFVARSNAMEYPNADMYIFSGTNHNNKLLSISAKILMGITKLFKGMNSENKLLDNMSYKSYQSKFNKTNESWISSDKNKLPSEDDKLCNFPFDNKTFNAMLCWTIFITKGKNIKWHPNVPTLFISGDEDPVGQFGKAPKKAIKAYKNKNKNVNLILYKGMRHEVLNEKQNEKVFLDILNFIKDN